MRAASNTSAGRPGARRIVITTPVPQGRTKPDASTATSVTTGGAGSRTTNVCRRSEIATAAQQSVASARNGHSSPHLFACALLAQASTWNPETPFSSSCNLKPPRREPHLNTNRVFLTPRNFFCPPGKTSSPGNSSCVLCFPTHEHLRSALPFEPSTRRILRQTLR